jgi:hypothetical protein
MRFWATPDVRDTNGGENVFARPKESKPRRPQGETLLLLLSLPRKSHAQVQVQRRRLLLLGIVLPLSLSAMMAAPAIVAPRLRAAEAGRYSVSSSCQPPIPTTIASSARRFHLAVVSVALVLAICANTMMVSSAVPSSFRRASQSASNDRTNTNQGSPGVRSNALARASNDQKLDGALLASPKQRMLIKKVTRLRHKLEATVQAVQKQLDGPTGNGSDLTNA